MKEIFIILDTEIIPTKLLQFFDLVYLYTVKCLYKASNMELLHNIQKLFTQKDGDYSIFKQPTFRIIRKTVLVCEIKLENQNKQFTFKLSS